MFPYPGRKHKLAGLYPPPVHGIVVEPFAGSAAYAHRHLARLSHVVLVERDALVVEMWRQLLDPALADDDVCPPLSVGERTGNPFHLAAAVSGGGQYRSLRATEVMAVNVAGLRGRLASDRARWQSLRVDIVHGDYTAAPDVEATWFVDPPYRGRRFYRHGSAAIDFDALGGWCRGRDGQVIVCEGEGADWLPFGRLGDVVGVGGKRSGEVVWLSGPTSVCVECGQRFERRRNDGRVPLCSSGCRRARAVVRQRERRRATTVARSAVCERCGRVFHPRRVDARLCSGRCRVAAHRARV